MDLQIHNVLVQMMGLSPFSEEEQHPFQAEEMVRRRFMFREHKDEVPGTSSVRPMEAWLKTKRNFLNELRENFERMRDEVFWIDLDWTAVRSLCAPLTEEDLLVLYEEEKKLSELHNIKVSLGGFFMLISSFFPWAKRDVQSFLHILHKQLLQVFLGITTLRDPAPAGDTREVNPLQLEQFAAPVVSRVVKTALKLLLEEAEQGEQEEAASTEIGQLLVEAVAPYLFSHDVTENDALLRGICSAVALLIFRTLSKRFDVHCKLFQEKEECCFTSFVMSKRRQSNSPSQVHHQLSSSSDQDQNSFSEERGTPESVPPEEENQEDQQGHMEERGDFPQVPLDDMSEDISIIHPASGSTLSFGEKPEDLPPSATSSQVPSGDNTSETAENQPVETHITATEELGETLLERRVASSEVTATPSNETRDAAEVKVGTNISVDSEQDSPQQVKVDSSETQEAPCEDCWRKTRKRRKGGKAFFHGVWRSLTSCSCCSTD